MKTKQIEKIGIWTSVMLVLLILSAAVLELTRPGSIVCPLRRLAKKAGYEMELAELSHAQLQEAKSMAAAWREEMLAAYPQLRATSREVPDAENGYLQMLELSNHATPSQALRRNYEFLESGDVAAARDALDKNAAWVSQVERVASLTHRSNLGTGSDYLLIDASICKTAIDTMMLQAWVHAADARQDEALRSMDAANHLAQHLVDVECPNLLNLTISTLMKMSQGAMIHDHILPALGANANLSAWREQLEKHAPSQDYYRHTLRGEWHYFAHQYAAATLFGEHLQRALIDPHETASALTRRCVVTLKRLESCDLKDLDQSPSSITKPDLSPEGMFWYESSTKDDWGRGYIRCIRMHARSLAAIELLILERKQGSITAADTKALTPDPYTGDPFVFDPQERTIACPGSSTINDVYGGDEPLKLPW